MPGRGLLSSVARALGSELEERKRNETEFALFWKQETREVVCQTAEKVC